MGYTRVVHRPPLPRRPHRIVRAVRRAPGDLGGLATIVTLVVALGAYGARRGGGSTRLDALTFFLPWYSRLGERLRAGDIPGWNPHVFGGVPFAGDPESGWTYLPAMLAFVLFPPVAALHAYAILHYGVAGFASYALGRMIGLGVPAAVVAGVSYAVSFPLERSRCCTARSTVASWLPVALLGVELAVRARSRLGRAAAWGLAGLGVAQMLAGWLGQGSYYGLLAVGGYVAYRTLLSPPRPRPLARRPADLAIHGAGVLAFGFGLAAAGVLPRLAAVERSSLAGGVYDEAAAGAADPGGWPWPLALDRLTSDDGTGRFYLGWATLGLALAAPPVAGRRAAAPYWLGLSLAAFILSLADTPLHRLFYLLPRFEVLHEHAPNRATIVLALGPALLAGIAVDRFARARRASWRLLIAAAIPFLALMITIDLLAAYDRTITPGAQRAARLTVYLLALLALSRTRLPRRLGMTPGLRFAIPAVLALLVFWEPTGEVMRANLLRGPNTTAFATRDVYAADADPGGAGEFLRGELTRALSAGEGPFRFFGYDPSPLRPPSSYHARYDDPLAQDLLVNNRAIRLGLHDVQGYNPLQPERHVDFVAALNGRAQEYHESNVLPTGLASPLLDLLNARFLIVPNAVPPGRPDLLHLSQTMPTVFRGERVRVLENPEALPRAWIVHAARRAAPNEALALLAGGAVDPRAEALLEVDPPDLAPPPEGTTERVLVTDYEGDRLRLQVTAAAPGLVVLSETYDPDWRATIDGAPVDVLAANGALRAVPVPAGEHTVELRYEPRSLRIGVAVSLFAVALWAGLAGAFIIRRRRPVPFSA